MCLAGFGVLTLSESDIEMLDFNKYILEFHSSIKHQTDSISGIDS